MIVVTPPSVICCKQLGTPNTNSIYAFNVNMANKSKHINNNKSAAISAEKSVEPFSLERTFLDWMGVSTNKY